MRRALFLKDERARFAVRFERDDFSKVDLSVLATAINSLIASRVLKPRGLLDYPTAAQKDFTRAWGNYQYVPAGHASAPTDANLVSALISLVATLRKPYKGNARFLMNSNTAVRLRSIVDANGRALWSPTGSLIEGIEHPLLGYPVEIDEGMDDIGAGTFPIAFGDFRQGYVIVDRLGVRINRDELTQKGRASSSMSTNG